MTRTNPPVTGTHATPADGSPEDALISRLRAAGCVFAEDEAALLTAAAESPDARDRLVARRVAGEPLEHLLGWVAFGGERISVTTGVFVPRQRTTALVDRAEAAVRARSGTSDRPPVLVDLCCGCGAIGTVVAARLARASAPVEVHAADVDPVATACAAANLAPYGGQVHTGDLYDPLPPSLRGRVDVVVANVPYVPASAVATMPPEARDHEPRIALEGGADGLTVARRLVTEAPAWLAPGGIVLFECDESQAAAAADAVRAAGLIAGVATDSDRDVSIVSGIAR